MLAGSKVRLASVEERLTGLDRIAHEKFITLQTYMKLEADKVSLALAASDKAIIKAETANEKRFESVNEFRAQLNDQAASFVSRLEHNATIEGIKSEHNSAMKSIVEKFDDMKTRLDKAEGRGVGLNAGWVYIIGGIAAVGTIISIFLVFKP